MSAHNPVIAKEMGLLDKAVAITDAAMHGLQGGALEVKQVSAMISGGKLYHTVAMGSISIRQAAPKLALNEAKLIENEKPKAIEKVAA